MRRRIKIALLGLVSATLVIGFSVVGAGPASTAEAHFDPPGLPLRVTVTVTGVATNQNSDPGLGNAELEIDYTITRPTSAHAGKGPETGERIHSNYAWNGVNPGNLAATNVQIYDHDSCTPFDDLTIQLKLKEDDPLDDDNLGTGTATWTAANIAALPSPPAPPGGLFGTVPKTITTAAPGNEDGTGRVEITVTAAAPPVVGEMGLWSRHCETFNAQLPEGAPGDTQLCNSADDDEDTQVDEGCPIVGGIEAGLLGAPDVSAEENESSGADTTVPIAAALAAGGVLALAAGGGWYARRRWLS